MSPAQIGIFILALLGAIITAALIVQGVENQKRERRLRILALKDQIRRGEHLLHAIPPELINSDLQQLLIAYLLQRWRELDTLDNSLNGAAHIQQLSALQQQNIASATPASGLTLFSNREMARAAKAIMREAAQFLTDLQASGRYSVGQLQPVMNAVKIGYARARADLEIQDAVETERQRGPLVALHLYRSNERALTKLANHVQVDNQLALVRTQIERCELALEKQKAAQEAARLEAQQEEERLQRNPLDDSERYD